MKTRSWLLKFILAIIIFPATQARAQGVLSIPEPITIKSQGNHALASLLLHLQHLYSTAINFEEAPVENASDIVTNRSEVLRLKNGNYMIMARGGPLAVQLDSSHRTAYQAVQAALTAYVASGLPGSYRAVDLGDHVDVIPVSTIGVTGSMRATAPVMDFQITLDTKERDFPTLLDDIAASISKSSIYPVHACSPMQSGGMDTIVVNGEPARSLLTRLTGNLSYQVLFDVNIKSYCLNIGPVLEALPHAPVPNPPRSATTQPKPNPFFIKTTPSPSATATLPQQP